MSTGDGFRVPDYPSRRRVARLSTKARMPSSRCSLANARARAAPLEKEALGEGGLVGLQNARLCEAQGEEALPGDDRGQLQGAFHGAARVHDFGHQAGREGFRGVHGLTAQDEAHGKGLAGQPRQALGRAVAGMNAEIDLGLPEGGAPRPR